MHYKYMQYKLANRSRKVKLSTSKNVEKELNFNPVEGKPAVLKYTHHPDVGPEHFYPEYRPYDTNTKYRNPLYRNQIEENMEYNDHIPTIHDHLLNTIQAVLGNKPNKDAKLFDILKGKIHITPEDENAFLHLISDYESNITDKLRDYQDDYYLHHPEERYEFPPFSPHVNNINDKIYAPLTDHLLDKYPPDIKSHNVPVHMLIDKLLEENTHLGKNPHDIIKNLLHNRVIGGNLHEGNEDAQAITDHIDNYFKYLNSK